MSGSLRDTLRLGWIYAAVYAANGLYTPFLPVWLRSAGLTQPQIGLVLAAPLLARVATSPAAAMWADRFRLRRTPIALMALAAAAAMAALPLKGGVLAVAVLWFLAATLAGGLAPLVDVAVLRVAAERGLAFARVRSVGSAAYIAANLLGGVGLAWFGPNLVPFGAAAFSTCAAVLAWRAMPPVAVRLTDRVDGAPAGAAALAALWRNRRYMMVIVSAGLIQASHAYYYSFSALLWREQGFKDGAVGGLWGLAVLVEIAFLMWGEGLRRRLGPERLLIAGALGALIRWSGLMASPPLVIVGVLQGLHSLSFTATFIASVQLVERLCPPDAASTAQSLNAALYSGLFLGLATLASGRIAATSGAGGYGLMALLALAGLALAILVFRDLARSGGARRPR